MEKLPKEVSTSILLLVHRSGKLTMSEICEKTKFSTITVLKHVNALMEADLLGEEREKNFPRRRLIKTTDEGARIAALLNLSDKSGYGSSELIEMGSKAGRVSSYQEMQTTLRRANVTKDYLIAELLLKGVGSLAEGLGLTAKGFPADAGASRDAIMSAGKKLEAHFAEGQKHLKANDIHGCVGEISRALNELSGETQVFSTAVAALKQRKLNEIANYLEFFGPMPTQKE